ncbi:hypothetical protein V8E53_005749 [Lactarius tabidus]
MHKQQSNQNYPSSLRSCWKEASGQNVQGHGDGRVKIGQFGRHKRSWHNFSADEMKLREMGSCLEPGKQKERESGQAWMLEDDFSPPIDCTLLEIPEDEFGWDGRMGRCFLYITLKRRVVNSSVRRRCTVAAYDRLLQALGAIHHVMSPDENQHSWERARMRISRPPASSSPDVEMHAVNSHEDPVQDRARTDVCSASPPPRRYNNWVPDPRDIISVTSSSDSPPARRSARMSKKRATQFMAHVLVPPLPPGARRSDYSSVKERPRTRDPWAPGMGKTRAGDNSGSNKLMHHEYEPGEKKRKKRTKNKPAKEIVVVVDDESKREEDLKSVNFSTGSSTVPAMARGSTRRRLRRETRVEVSSDSASVEVIITSPTMKCPRAHAASNHHTPVTPKGRVVQGGKALDERESDGSDAEVEIVGDVPRGAAR